MVKFLVLLILCGCAFVFLMCGVMLIRYFDRKAFEKECKQEDKDNSSTEVYRFSKEDGFKIIKTKTATIIDYTQANISEQADPVKRNNIVISHDRPSATGVGNGEES